MSTDYTDIEYDSLYDASNHELRLRTCHNLRELGGYDTPYGSTRLHRFVRCGSTSGIVGPDLQIIQKLGITRALDLRSRGEAPRATCRLARQSWISWENIPLFDYDLSAPAMMPVRDVDNYLVTSYLHMLTSVSALQKLFAFLSATPKDECALFHCAAGMDRTGVVSMLLLGLVEVPRKQIIADYAYSFGDGDVVDAAIEALGTKLETPSTPFAYILDTRIKTIATVYDTVIATHGSIRAFLTSCEIPETELDALRAHLLDP